MNVPNIGRRLRFECEWECIDCKKLLVVRTYQAVVDGMGQLVVCSGCGRPYVVKHDGAHPQDRHNAPEDVRILKPLPSSLGLFQPPHKLQTLPFDPTICYVCGVAVKDHPPEPTRIQ
jgi:hypothetical protein